MRVRASILTIAALVVGFAVHTRCSHAVVGGAPARSTSDNRMTQQGLEEREIVVLGKSVVGSVVVGGGGVV